MIDLASYAGFGVRLDPADAQRIAGDEFLDALHVAPPLRPGQGMGDGLANRLERRFDVPDGDEAVFHVHSRPGSNRDSASGTSISRSSITTVSMTASAWSRLTTWSGNRVVVSSHSS